MDRRHIASAFFATAVGAAVLPSRAQAQSCPTICYPLANGETANLITAWNYPPGDIRRYGAVANSGSSCAANNSGAIQTAVNVARAAGGGTVYVPAGVYCIDAPIKVYERVSIVGDGPTASILKKTTATPSTISDGTSRFWDGAAVGYPVCVLHFVNYDQSSVWAYAEARDIGVQGNTSSPNTSSVVYGFFFRGMAGARVKGCYAQNVQVGYFWGSGSVITSEVSLNLASEVQRAFYMHFATSTDFRNNYAVRWRFAAYYFSGYYCHVAGNATDHGGDPSVRVSSTEIAQAYEFHSCVGTTIESNGCESHNGPVWLMESNISTQFRSNLAIAVSSDYTGSSNIAAFSSTNCIDCVYEDNRVVIVGLTGTPARHFNWRTTTEYGAYRWARNHFYTAMNQTGADTGWVNTFGTL